MASSLTTTSLKSASLYVAFLTLVIAGVFYLLGHNKNQSTKLMMEKAFLLNASAFENGIQLAHSKFLVDENKSGLLSYSSSELDFNTAGFPVGTSIEKKFRDHPYLSEHCVEIWQSVLSPLHPPMQLFPSENNYWVNLTDDNICVYRRSNLPKMSISYHSGTGTVVITK